MSTICHCPTGEQHVDGCFMSAHPAKESRGTIHLWGDEFYYCDEGWGKVCHDEARGDCLSLIEAKEAVEWARLRPAPVPESTGAQETVTLHRINYRGGPSPWAQCPGPICGILPIASGEHAVATITRRKS